MPAWGFRPVARRATRFPPLLEPPTLPRLPRRHASCFTPDERSYCLKEIPQLEMQLPAGIGATIGVHPVEAITQIHPDGTQRRDHSRAEAGPPEEPGRIPLAGRAIDVAGVEECTDVERLPDSPPRLDG